MYSSYIAANSCSCISLLLISSKIYSFDSTKAVITSANLTFNGLVKNYEYGVLVDDMDTMFYIEDDLQCLIDDELSGEMNKDSVDFIKNQDIGNDYTARIEESIKNVSQTGEDSSDASDYDEYFAQAGKFVIEKDKGSIGMLQRVFKIGFNRAARIMDQLEEAGVVGAEEGTKPRKILMTLEQFEYYLSEN